jgi:hypothetical protein
MQQADLNGCGEELKEGGEVIDKNAVARIKFIWNKRTIFLLTSTHFP